jgi:hypothetical protein
MAKLNLQKVVTRGLQKSVGVAAGAIGAKAVNKVIPGSISPLIVGAGKIVGGAILDAYSKEGMVRDAAAGVIAVGALELAGNMMPALVSGPSEDSAFIEEADYKVVAGPGDEEEFQELVSGPDAEGLAGPEGLGADAEMNYYAD